MSTHQSAGLRTSSDRPWQPFYIEQRSASRLWRHVVVNLGAVVAALVVGAALLLVAGDSPIDVYREVFDKSFGSARALRETLRTTTPLLLTGLAVVVVFRMGLWSIGAEGQLIAGAIAASAVALLVGQSLPALPALVLVFLAAATAGAVWAALAAVPRALFGTDEVVTTLMLNFVALGMMNYLIFGSVSFWRDRENLGFPAGKVIPESTQLHLFFGVFDIGIVVAVTLAIATAIALRATVWGFQLRVAGESQSAAKYAGIDARRQIMGVFVLSGALAGLAGGAQVTSITYGLEPLGIATGLGFMGIVVASIALLDPLLAVPVALFVGAMLSTAPSLSIIGVSPAVVIVIQGVILLFVAGSQFFMRFRVRIRRRDSAHE